MEQLLEAQCVVITVDRPRGRQDSPASLLYPSASYLLSAGLRNLAELGAAFLSNFLVLVLTQLIIFSQITADYQFSCSDSPGSDGLQPAGGQGRIRGVCPALQWETGANRIIINWVFIKSEVVFTHISLTSVLLWLLIISD